MKSSYILLFCGLSQLLLFVAAANPPDPCTDPSNYNLVVPLRTSRTANAFMNFPVDTTLTLYNGCYNLQLYPYSGLYVSQNTQADTTPSAYVTFNGYFTDSCNGNSGYLSGYHYYPDETLLTVSNNVNHASLAGFSVSGNAYLTSGTVPFNVTTTPGTFEGHSPATSKSNTRSVSRTGSQCRIVYQYNSINNRDTSTNSFTMSLFVGDYGQIDFLVPSNVTAIFGTSTGGNTYHQCTCNGL